jgi:serine/threonine protein kinase
LSVTNVVCEVTELAANGSVEDVLKDKSIKVSFHRKMKIARETAAGMNWLHCMKPSPLLHLDLKTANLLVSRFNMDVVHVPPSNSDIVNS